MISIRLSCGGQITHCDLLYLPTSNINDGSSQRPAEAKSAYLALAGPSLPNRVAIYQLSFDFGSSM